MDVKDLKLKMKPVVRLEKPKKTCVVHIQRQLKYKVRGFLFALVIRRTGLHDLSDLATRRTMQINSRPTEIIMRG